MANQNSPTVWAFLAELVTRLKSKSPKFFVVIGWITAVIGFFAGIPTVISEINSMLPADAAKIVLPAFFIKVQSYFVTAAVIWTFILAKLPVQRDAEIPDATKLPFTAKKETDPSVDTRPSKGL